MASAYVAGVGITLVDASSARSNHILSELAISAGMKALLDAGVTYGDVNQSVACFLDQDLNIPKACFATFGKTGSSSCEVDSYSGFNIASQSVKSGYASCVLMIGLDKVFWTLLVATATGYCQLAL